MSKAKKTAGKPKTATSQLRIIGGSWRSRRISFTAWDGLRPTPDRVRETLFNWLSFDIEARSCLDLFAGTGILGLEALSRGAKTATFVDSSASSCQQLRQNVKLLDAGCEPTPHSARTEVLQFNVMNFLQTNPKGMTYEVVFADPPFRQGLLAPMMTLLESQHWLGESALIYIESEAELTKLDTPGNWEEIKQKQAGQVIYRLFRRHAKNSAS